MRGKLSLMNQCKQRKVQTVVSLLHHFLENYGFGEKEVHLRVDYCSGQNKNSCMIIYLIWCVLTGCHKVITLCFLIAGHTKFSCDWCSGLVKRKFKRSKVDSLADMERVVTESAKAKFPQLVEMKRIFFLSPLTTGRLVCRSILRKLRGFKNFTISFSTKNPRGLLLKEASDPEESVQKLLLAQPPSDQLPLLVQSEGLSPQPGITVKNFSNP